MQRIVPHLWFDRQAQEASYFYTSVFPDSRITSIRTLHDTPSGDAEVVAFEIAGSSFMAISAGPHFSINPSISFSVNCDSVSEIDTLWKRLSEGGNVLMALDAYPFAERYGWCNDRFGVSWQLIVSQRSQKIAPYLLFTQAQAGKTDEAIEFYTSIFPDSGVTERYRYRAKQEGGPVGKVSHAIFTLAGQEFMAADGYGPHAFAFNEAVSLVVRCANQDEIDRLWEGLSAVPEAEQCGWLKDRYGVSWQIVPTRMDEMMAEGSPEQVARVTKAFLSMKKFDIAALQRAFDGQH